jgi:uracil-DNA glycosylase
MTREQVNTIFGTWADLVAPFATSPEMDKIFKKLSEEKAAGIKIYPEQKLIFRCFQEVKMEDLRFVMIAQDPYPVEGLSNGLAFSTVEGIKPTSTLDLIYKAIDKDMGKSSQPRNNDLSYLCKQGGLLLNYSLTVQDSKPNSHKDIWQPFTDFLITRLQECSRGILWFCFGKDAQLAVKNVDIFAGGHFVLAEEHPIAALYRAKTEKTEPEWNAKCFSKANAIIRLNRLGEPINW